MFMIPKWEDLFETKANKIIILGSSQLNHLQSSPPVTKLKPSKSLFHPIRSNQPYMFGHNLT